MKKINAVVLGLIVTMGLSSCIKDVEPFDPNAQYQIEKPLIEEYAKKNLVDPIFNAEYGVWYQIIQPGQADSYEYKLVNNGQSLEYPNVTVKYTGKLLNGVVFDDQQKEEGIKFSLAGNIIPAWPIAFYPVKIGDEPVGGLTAQGLKLGSKIRFVAPSRICYGNQARGADIPANSPLDFTIEVLKIEAPTTGAN